MKALKFIFTGILFGIVMTKSEAISWYRIQEMFRFQSFHMFSHINSLFDENLNEIEELFLILMWQKN